MKIFLVTQSDMQFVTNLTRIKCQNDFLHKKHVNYEKLCFPTEQRKLYIGLPKVNLCTTKCVTKRP